MAFFLSPRQERAVQYAKNGRCTFAQATLRDEFRVLQRKGVGNPMDDWGYRRAAAAIKNACGTALGAAKAKPSRSKKRRRR